MTKDLRRHLSLLALKKHRDRAPGIALLLKHIRSSTKANSCWRLWAFVDSWWNMLHENLWPLRASQSCWLHTMMTQFLSVAENSELRLSCSCSTHSLSLPSASHLKSKAGTEQLGRGKRWRCLPSRWHYSIHCVHPYAHTLTRAQWKTCLEFKGATWLSLQTKTFMAIIKLHRSTMQGFIVAGN